MTLTFELGRDFCAMHLTAKLHRRTLNHSEVIVLTNKQTNKQTPLKTSTSLRYATPVGNNVRVSYVYVTVIRRGTCGRAPLAEASVYHVELLTD